MIHPLVDDVPSHFFTVSNPPPGFDPKSMNVVRVFRHALGYTQRAIAERCDVTPALVQYWETGRAFPTPQNLPTLAKAIGVHPVSLVAWLTVFVPPERPAAKPPRTDMSARRRKSKAA
jgi:transcriptional regulator with XRE-family HTH domain